MPNQDRVFDSWALLAFLQDEPAAEQVEELIVEAQAAESELLVTTVNLGEVWYGLARARSDSEADKGVSEISGLGFQVVDVSWNLTRQAAVFKAKGKVAYADCFAAALAKLRKVEVVTGDPEFKAFESEVKVHWLATKPARA
jgi:ribonuclease VapC